jgi:hypothetical protein
MTGHSFLVDLIGEGVNELWCECGVRLWPHCDMSRVSINECFREHQETATGPA